MKFWNHQLEVLPTRRCGEYVESLEIEFRLFTRGTKRARAITSSNRCYLSNLDIARGA